MKHIVVCGPDLSVWQTRLTLGLKFRYDDEISNVAIPQYILPETTMGAEKIRELVDFAVDKGYSFFATRYEHAVSQFACAVVNGDLKKEDVLFVLIRQNEDGSELVTEHFMGDEYMGNDWPMGILW